MTTLARTSRRPASGPTSLQREHHAPDYVILVAVVALAAIGILMVYSSSAMTSYLADDDTFKIVGPQVVWAALGLVAHGRGERGSTTATGGSPRCPLYVVALGLLAVVVFVPSLNYVVGGSARFLRIGPLPLFHPAEFAKLALVIYLAHWFARRGTSVRGFWRGTVVVPRHHGAGRRASSSASRTWARARSSGSRPSRCSSSPGPTSSTCSPLGGGGAGGGRDRHRQPSATS